MAKSKLKQELQDLKPLTIPTDSFISTPIELKASADLDDHVNADLKVAHSVLLALSGAWSQVRSVAEACLLANQIMTTVKQRRELSLHAVSDKKAGGSITVLP